MRQQKSVRLGVEIGDHSLAHRDYLGFIQTHYDLDRLEFVLIYTKPDDIPEALFYEWAEFFRAHEIDFAFLYTLQKRKEMGKNGHLSPKILKRIRDIAGDYFIGDMIGETGGNASWPKGYFTKSPLLQNRLPEQNLPDMAAACSQYVNYVGQICREERALGVESILAVEATALSPYNFEAGVDAVFMETMCGNPEQMLSFARGASRAYGKTIWGSHIAHEWYGGLRQDDPLKYKRMKLAYCYAYLAGANYIYSESGDCGIYSYGYHYEPDDANCAAYRLTWTEFSDWLRCNPRPAGGPLVRVAFVQGNTDGYTGWGGSTVWNQYDREAWGFSDAEEGWRRLPEILRQQHWSTPENFGDADYSGLPAYGQFDIIPSSAPAEKMCQYDYLIFLGYHVMPAEIYQNLISYVKRGGNLLLSASHCMADASRPQKEKLFLDGRLEELLGCSLSCLGSTINSGVKFCAESTMPGVILPKTGNLDCDPICAGGYYRIADTKLAGAETLAVFTDTFFQSQDSDKSPAVLQNRLGGGTVMLSLNLDYPGTPSVWPLYSTLIRSLLAGSRRSCDLQVFASDRVAYSVYEENGEKTVCLLNTDYNVAQQVHLTGLGQNFVLNLAPLELKLVKLGESTKVQ